MIPQEPNSEHSPHAAIEDRCAQIGLPIIHTDDTGELARSAWPTGGRVAEQLLERIVNAPAFKKALRAASAKWLTHSQPDPAVLINGWTLVPIPITARRERAGYINALLLSNEGISGGHFQTLCQSARVDATLAAKLLAPAAQHSKQSVTQLAFLLKHTFADLSELGSAENAINGFSTQLAESYEEINLLYSIGRAMKELVSADAFVTHVCQRMHETLPYRWIAIRFLHTYLASPKLSGRTFIEGVSDTLDNDGMMLINEIVRHVSNADTHETTVFTASPEGPEVLCRAITRDDNVVGVVIAAEKHGDDTSDTAVTSVDMKLIEGATRLTEVAIANSALYEEQQAFFLGTIEALSSAIDAKDPYTCGHSQRVSELSLKLAQTIGLSPAECETIRISGLVHDIGKIGVPESVLLKTSRLTDKEFGAIKLHPEIGHRILRGIPMFDDALPGVLHHHERWDGRGYPVGLAGTDIPLIARIIGVADAFDAMSSSRTYRSAMDRAKVIGEIKANAGSQFDPELSAAFLTLDLNFYDKLLAQHAPLSKSEAA